MWSFPILQFAFKTDTGLVRAHNEDSIVVNADYKIAVLADGMGGYNAGEVASSIATSAVANSLVQRLRQSAQGPRSATSKFLHQLMRASVIHANAQILDVASAQPQFSGMGTTLVAALFHQNRVMLAHVGDSRAYRIRHSVLTQLTQDHSQLQKQIDAGLISPEGARFASNRNLITRALGIGPNVDIDINEYDISDADVYLLCSDGLNDMLSSEQIVRLFHIHASNIDDLCDALIQSANYHGGRDNVSVVLIKVDMVGSQSPGATPHSPIKQFSTWFKRFLAN